MTNRMQNKERQIIFFFCYRILEFRILFSTGLLNKLIEDVNLVIFVPPRTVTEVSKIVPDNVFVEPILYCHNSQKLGNKKTNIKDIIRNSLCRILSLTYARKNIYPHCGSQKTQIATFLQQRQETSLPGKVVTNVMMLFVKWASSSRAVRVFLQLVIKQFYDNQAHKKFFVRYKPKLVIVGSMGLDADGFALFEARENSIPSVVLTQTWDRSTCKGFPPISPNYVFAWSKNMADEIHHYLDIPRNRILIEGATVWDHLFKTDRVENREVFIDSLGLSPKMPVIYFPLTSKFWHADLLKTLQFFGDQLQENSEFFQFQFIFRLHPYYWSDERSRLELEAILDKISQNQRTYVDLNKTKDLRDGHMLEPEDMVFQKNCYYHSDVCISVASTCMIESIMCGTPSINMQYGRWVTGDKDVEIRNFVLHHLQRIYRFNAIYQSFSAIETLRLINEVLQNPQKLRGQMKALINSEASVNKGMATMKTAEQLVKLSKV